MKADQKTISPASNQEHRAEPSSNGTSSAATKKNGNRSASPGWHIWLVRIRALLFVTLCATFGVLLLILPWTPKWTDNPLLLSFPSLRDIVSSGFVRGVASGLGLMDLWLGFWEAIHYHETPMGC